MALHDKVDRMREDDLKSLILKQQEQLDLLLRLVGQVDTKTVPVPGESR